MKLFTAVWAAAFVGWDLAYAVDAARTGDWGFAGFMAGMAALTAVLGVGGYRQKPGWFR